MSICPKIMSSTVHPIFTDGLTRCMPKESTSVHARVSGLTISTKDASKYTKEVLVSAISSPKNKDTGATAHMMLATPSSSGWFLRRVPFHPIQAMAKVALVNMWNAVTRMGSGKACPFGLGLNNHLLYNTSAMLTAYQNRIHANVPNLRCCLASKRFFHVPNAPLLSFPFLFDADIVVDALAKCTDSVSNASRPTGGGARGLQASMLAHVRLSDVHAPSFGSRVEGAMACDDASTCAVRRRGEGRACGPDADGHLWMGPWNDASTTVASEGGRDEAHATCMRDVER
mmetsp:Transcript_8120/g.50242  ORF Transcript_8120/g.50242 Transcript_8120/m.50242 type:complete len:286 (+) Transcript_8120:3658-4515(+)